MKSIRTGSWKEYAVIDTRLCRRIDRKLYIAKVCILGTLVEERSNEDWLSSF